MTTALTLWRPQPDSVYHMDALTLMHQCAPGSVDAIITDPPYGCGTQVSAWRSPDKRFTEIEGVNEINDTWLDDAFRALRPTGAFYCFTKWVNFGEWKTKIEAAGFTVHNCIVWDKMQHGTGNLLGAYGPQHEFILFATKGLHYLRGKRPVDILRFAKVPPTELIHPYQKPVELLEYLIIKSTDVADVVCDPFSGSGALAIAARNTGRRYILGDSSAEYAELARLRITGTGIDLLNAKTPEPLEALPLFAQAVNA